MKIKHLSSQKRFNLPNEEKEKNLNEIRSSLHKYRTKDTKRKLFIKWSFVIFGGCLLSASVYMFYFQKTFSHQNTVHAIQDAGVLPVSNETHSQPEKIIVDTRAITADFNKTPHRLEWRDYWDGVYAIEQEKFNNFTNAVTEVNPWTGIVVADYVELLRDHCGYITDMETISSTINQSELFSFLIAILRSTEAGNFQLYNEAVRLAKNVAYCDNEKMWISNIRQVL